MFRNLAGHCEEPQGVNFDAEQRLFLKGAESQVQENIMLPRRDVSDSERASKTALALGSLSRDQYFASRYQQASKSSDRTKQVCDQTRNLPTGECLRIVGRRSQKKNLIWYRKQQHSRRLSVKHLPMHDLRLNDGVGAGFESNHSILPEFLTVPH
jgi:hypothetical protein